MALSFTSCAAWPCSCMMRYVASTVWRSCSRKGCRTSKPVTSYADSSTWTDSSKIKRSTRTTNAAILSIDNPQPALLASSKASRRAGALSDRMLTSCRCLVSTCMPPGSSPRMSQPLTVAKYVRITWRTPCGGKRPNSFFGNAWKVRAIAASMLPTRRNRAASAPSRMDAKRLSRLRSKSSAEAFATMARTPRRPAVFGGGGGGAERAPSGAPNARARARARRVARPRGAAIAAK
mmetsp:Transcript_94766/g.289943  ORF Transcript_94766/g.289943 Transcript_94766/m.289943 type:complete len:235 (-) Transcript_94766:129-833(-)